MNSYVSFFALCCCCCSVLVERVLSFVINQERTDKVE